MLNQDFKVCYSETVLILITSVKNVTSKSKLCYHVSIFKPMGPIFKNSEHNYTYSLLKILANNAIWNCKLLIFTIHLLHILIPLPMWQQGHELHIYGHQFYMKFMTTNNLWPYHIRQQMKGLMETINTIQSRYHMNWRQMPMVTAKMHFINNQGYHSQRDLDLNCFSRNSSKKPVHSLDMKHENTVWERTETDQEQNNHKQP